MRFGVTYEGLKPKISSQVVLNRSCFGVTYEGLKLEDQVHYSSFHARFGVTYEGLKHCSHHGHRASQSAVLELPMRV